MSLVGFRAQNHPQQKRKDKVDDRATPPELFDPLHERYGFTLDAAAASHNTKCERFYSIEDDGLSKSWAGERVWCNPPYSDIRPWVQKAHAESCMAVPESGIESHAELIAMLLPANRTEQAWWQDLVEPYRDRAGKSLTVQFIRGRQRFIRAGQTEVGPNERPPFGVCLLVWDNRFDLAEWLSGQRHIEPVS